MDELCSICGEPRSAHVATEAGPLTHPREARGEGRYVQVAPGYTMGMGVLTDDIDVAPRYEFVPSEDG